VPFAYVAISARFALGPSATSIVLLLLLVANGALIAFAYACTTRAQPAAQLQPRACDLPRGVRHAPCGSVGGRHMSVCRWDIVTSAHSLVALTAAFLSGAAAGTFVMVRCALPHAHTRARARTHSWAGRRADRRHGCR
jgi:hypothetical protein